MHHHHPPLPITSSTAVTPTTTVTSTAANVAAISNTHPPQQQQQQQQQQRRRKKRPNYGTRVVEVQRGYNGFGFTISGQQPCRLSCTIPNSPAEQAGLRAGDFLISVNGLNVSKMPHETVVQLIGNSFGSIRMQIAENYFSDSSDEENVNASLLMQQQNSPGGRCILGIGTGSGLRVKPRFLHHKTKMHRLRNSPQKKRENIEKLQKDQRLQKHPNPPNPPNTLPMLVQNLCDTLETPELLRPVVEDLPLPALKQCALPISANAGCVQSHASSDVANVSAMVRVVASDSLEYRAIVGYLGTIEMPKQISHSSKLQTVRSCIRKLRQEKRQPTIVLMSILPDCLRLQSANGTVLATYASSRLNYVSSSSESENRFFGLVTSAVHNTQIDEEYELEANDEHKSVTGHISISHSCHVFVIDTKLIEHTQHLQRAAEFRIQCTRDPISSICLEFPNNSEYVVNLIRSMYTMRILPPATRSLNEYEAAANAGAVGGGVFGAGVAGVAHSPQPSNHSEISTTTSNSDSGIGFNNDCTNISDRILVVDFPGLPALPAAGAGVQPPLSLPLPRPLGICCQDAMSTVQATSVKRLTVRAMPDPKSPAALRRPNLLANFNLIKSPATSLTATRSCDDVLNLVTANGQNADGCRPAEILPTHIASMDDISLHAASAVDEVHSFLHPSVFVNGLGMTQRKMRHSLQPTISAMDKLSPQVFGEFTKPQPPPPPPPPLTKKTRHSLGLQVTHTSPMQSKAQHAFNYDTLDTWCSLQDINASMHMHESTNACLLDATNSEPELVGNRQLPANASPFRRAWGQSSFRISRSDNNNSSNQNNCQLRGNSIGRRTASMTASENDVYIKSMDGLFDDINNRQSRSSLKQQQQKMGVQVPQIYTELPSPTKSTMPTTSKTAEELTDGPSGIAAWGTSFERMLQDPAGMQTFAEFLKKEFSAENIYFWTACERYRNLENDSERVAEARAIFAKHLSTTGTEPVNVDSQARNLSEEKLLSAPKDIFAPAQKQIFNLMKFDSYQRFIRSDLYKSCVEAEEKQKALPYSGENLDELLKINFHIAASSKLKKSASNAEDRRRKSLLPWHRKTRSKSRDRNELLTDASAKSNMLMPAPATKLAAPLSSSSLKIHSSTQNSLSDIYSSRSSLSSFDAGVSNAPQTAEQVCSLCRVILSDGATTIVQTRADETVGQLVERLLEKRGLSYQYYDVVFNGCSKSIDMQLPAQTLASKEVLIEQRVAFKLDLPDPKVISVKSKPKKQLHEVIRPILHKYNYSMTGVQVLLRDTHAILDLNQPVTTADGQRLQIVITQPTMQMVPDFQQSGGSNLPPKCLKPTLCKVANSTALPTVAKRTTAIAGGRSSIGAAVAGTGTTVATAAATPQSTLDEITNKVFNELLQGKVEKQRSGDLCSLKSEDLASETSSIFDRMRRRDSNIPGSKLPKFQKKKSTSSQHSEDVAILNANNISSLAVDPKKPIIAKLKAGVKLQVTERVAENQDELLEGLKRAQLARLEDQRGTEINFELPEFLKHKENLNAAASKLRKARANLSPITKPTSPITTDMSLTPTTPSNVEPPQPAPRPSITLKNKSTISPMKIDELTNETEENGSSASLADSPCSVTDCNIITKGPPPLPPKPKVLPIKPSNWGAAATTTVINYGNKPTTPTASNLPSPSTPTSKIPIDIGRKSLLAVEPTGTRCAYLDEPSSSFV